jgi:hypothetical protein
MHAQMGCLLKQERHTRCERLLDASSPITGDVAEPAHYLTRSMSAPNARSLFSIWS